MGTPILESTGGASGGTADSGVAQVVLTDYRSVRTRLRQVPAMGPTFSNTQAMILLRQHGSTDELLIAVFLAERSGVFWFGLPASPADAESESWPHSTEAGYVLMTQDFPQLARWATGVAKVRQSPGLRDALVRSIISSMAFEGYEIEPDRASELLDEALSGPPLLYPARE